MVQRQVASPVQFLSSPSVLRTSASQVQDPSKTLKGSNSAGRVGRSIWEKSTVGAAQPAINIATPANAGAANLPAIFIDAPPFA